MLVEEVDSNKVVSCLLCKTSFRVPGTTTSKTQGSSTPSDKATIDKKTP
jgi:hypothetical protein